MLVTQTHTTSTLNYLLDATCLSFYHMSGALFVGNFFFFGLVENCNKKIVKNP